MNLHGKFGDEKVALVICDHPKNPGYPTYWHARGYGCFCVNPFGGRAQFTSGKEPPLTTEINPGESIELKYRFLVYSGELSKEELDRQYDLYLQQVE